jgi:AcrR family transcriptional regulator
MPPKNILPKEAVIEKAFEILRKQGFQGITARNIAGGLGVSTMPIYVYFKTMDELKDILVKKAYGLLHEYQVSHRSGRPFFDMGLGYIAFAREEKVLFQEIMQNGQTSGNIADDFHFSELTQIMGQDGELAGLGQADFENILTKMWIFTHGLAGLISQNALQFQDNASIEKILNEAGGAMILFEHISKTEQGKTDDADIPADPDALFAGLEKNFHPEKAEGINAVYQFHITGAANSGWTVEVKNGSIQVSRGTSESADIVFEADTQTLAQIFSGTLSGTLAYITGRLKIEGDKNTAAGFTALFK